MREIAVCISNDNKNVTPIETINAIKTAGFKNVFIQWYDENWNPNQEDQLNYVRELGLNIIFAHLGYQEINNIWIEGEKGDNLVNRFKRNIKECKENDIDLVIMHLISGKKPPKYNEIGLNRIRKICDFAREHDVKIAFENTRDKAYLEYVLDNIQNENIGICFDSGHYHAYSKDNFNFERFKDKIFAIHLHDNDKMSDQHLIPFDGTLDWKYILNKLHQCNYVGPLTFEQCYRYDYLNMTVEEFYKKGYEVGMKLLEMSKEIGE